jgi:hypothetical protein
MDLLEPVARALMPAGSLEIQISRKSSTIAPMNTIPAIYECLYIYMLAAVISLGIATAIKCIAVVLTAQNAKSEIK